MASVENLDQVLEEACQKFNLNRRKFTTFITIIFKLNRATFKKEELQVARNTLLREDDLAKAVKFAAEELELDASKLFESE